MAFRINDSGTAGSGGASATAKPLVQPGGKTALIVIDIQHIFCGEIFWDDSLGNAQTKRVAKQIAKLAPAFRAAATPIYAVYYYHHRGMPRSGIDYYHFIPADEDEVIQKNRDSAFEGSDIHAILQRDGVGHLLISGVNLSACVKRTALDAVKLGYEVTLLRDLCANGNGCYRDVSGPVREMREAGVKFSHSAVTLMRQRAAYLPA